MIGTIIGNYEVKSSLGEGGMGKVYFAVDTQTKRKVAIKSLHQHLVNIKELRARFELEVKIMSLLEHNGIVRFYHYVEDEKGLFLIMEFVEGTTLDKYIRNGRLSEMGAVPIMNDILDAIAYAHEKGVVHRDIKPSNILISNDGKVKILDFGIAKILYDEGNILTKTGVRIGTVVYMSPEQVQCKESDIRSDIYSLGVTFFQMLTGKSPYDGMANEYEITKKIVYEPLPIASTIYPGVPADLDRIIGKATAKKKEDRFQTCREFSESLNNSSELITVITQPRKLISTYKKDLILTLKIVLFLMGVLIIFFIGLSIKSIIDRKTFIADSIIEREAFIADSARSAFNTDSIIEREALIADSTRKAKRVADATAFADSVASNTSPNATIDTISLEKNVYKKKKKGMNVLVSFKVNNLKNKTMYVCSYFYDNNNNKILGKSKNTKYTSTDGQLVACNSFTIPTNGTSYTDFLIYIPYSVFEIYKKGTFKVKVLLSVDGTTYATSSSKEFLYDPNN